MKDYFYEYLKISPFALSVWRGKEAEAIEEAYANANHKLHPKQKGDVFARPMLDLGCGFGEFAGVFFGNKVEVGIDISAQDLERANQGKKYKKLILADARKLPFANNTYATVLSMSVLEHIPKPELAIAEAFRVLKHGGLFVYTVPTVELNSNLFFPTLFRRIGLHFLADKYILGYHRVFKHLDIYKTEKWLQMTCKVGFRILFTKGTFPKSLTRLFDLFLITALPSQITRWLFGSRWVWGMPIKAPILEKLYQIVQRDQRLTNSNIVVIAQKP